MIMVQAQRLRGCRSGSRCGRICRRSIIERLGAMGSPPSHLDPGIISERSPRGLSRLPLRAPTGSYRRWRYMLASYAKVPGPGKRIRATGQTSAH
jgi:hypothetical protein